ncbi:uncharacterized protein L3040_004968 [Drepanopeziza brunnea f. sp. 'multigermtubi']|uniref:uncharacterized protein n=1 Tax=Drepanopeziza brunnea f. sp. 'multigermtubi' TaxID=698441 RepID=UPI00238D6422|nr:hypothetical protein L3040_004968 [Drepanopeziza brunnea f. sp. 'multigermtubi']
MRVDVIKTSENLLPFTKVVVANLSTWAISSTSAAKSSTSSAAVVTQMCVFAATTRVNCLGSPAVKIVMAEGSTPDGPGLRVEVNTLKTLGLDQGPLAEHFCLPTDEFEIRSGRKLFDTLDDDQDEHLCKDADDTWQATRTMADEDMGGSQAFPAQTMLMPTDVVVEIRRELSYRNIVPAMERLGSRPVWCKPRSRGRSVMHLCQDCFMRIATVWPRERPT